MTLRLLVERLSRLRDVLVRPITRPQSGISDFYRELGDLFGVPLTPRNRWGGFKAVRDVWQAHIDATLIRPVLIIDEAQEMAPAVLNDLRLLASRDYDSRTLLFVVLAGDGRLEEKLRLGGAVATQEPDPGATPPRAAAPTSSPNVFVTPAAAGDAQLMTRRSDGADRARRRQLPHGRQHGGGAAHHGGGARRAPD